MDTKRFLIILVAILSFSAIIGYAGSIYGITYTDYVHAAIKIGDGKNSNLSGTGIGNGWIADVYCVQNCSGKYNTTNVGTETNATNLTVGRIRDTILSTRINNTNQSYSYLIYTDGATYYAKNGSTGIIDFSGNNFTGTANLALNNSDNQKIIIAPGRYPLNYKNLTIARNNITLSGSGYSTILLMTNNSPPRQGIIVKTDADIYNSYNDGLYNEGAIIENLQIDGNRSNVPCWETCGDEGQQAGILLMQTRNTIIRNILMQHMTSDAIWAMNSGVNIKILDSTFTDVGNSGASGGAGIVASVSPEKITIAGNTINSNYQQCIRIQNEGGANSGNILITDNIIYNCGLSGIAVGDNQVSSIAGADITIQQILITGNTVYNVGGGDAANSAGVKIMSNAPKNAGGFTSLTSDVYIASNYMSGNNNRDIYIYTAADGKLANVKLGDNQLGSSTPIQLTATTNMTGRFKIDWGNRTTQPQNMTFGDTYLNNSRKKICYFNGTGWNSTSDAITNC